MDEATDKVWWPLHIRAAEGETLDAVEQASYEAGCRTLDAEGRLDGRLEELRQARQRTEELETKRLVLEALKAENEPVIEPEIINKDGVLVVRASLLEDISDIVEQEREARVAGLLAELPL